MRVDWFGQSAFLVQAEERSVAIDPFAEMSGLTSRGLQFDYPPIEGVEAELLLVTHEHGDHNGVQAIGGDPAILRSTAGRLPSPVGEVVAIASEHDEQAGTARGPNTIFVFELGGQRVCHFGDFGQRELREEQRAAIGPVDLLMLPVGGGLTIGAGKAHEIVAALRPRWVVPMHYRTERVNFLEPADEFLAGFEHVERFATSSFETAALPVREATTAVVPSAP
jgi:L-ascorbate metabolism protein UlaG (beta-lactamase superfamily)